MSIIEKIKRSWWIILSFILMVNGFGFVYIGFKNNNKHWVFEGVMYELPWLFSIFFSLNQPLFNKFFILASIMMLVSIVRSIWVAIKLADVYDNEDKYTVRPTVVNNHNKPRERKGSLTGFGCCLCLIAIFVVFAIIVL